MFNLKEVKVTMNRKTIIHRFLAGFLSVCLLLPAMPVVALADGKGKKDYRDGLRYEEAQQWDMAAQKFALAVNADPGNAEYKVHYLRALQQASMMFIKRGDTLAEQKDYASAYTAYRTAYNYDQGNEIAKMKMERMLDLQKVEMQGGDPVNYNPRTGAIKPISNDIVVANKPRSKGDVVQEVRFKDTEFKTVANTLGKQLGLNVVFDDQVKNGDKVTIELTDVTTAKALDIIMMQKKYTLEQVDRRTIFIYPDNTTNRPRFEKMLVKTFYLSNIGAIQARTVLTGMLPPGRQIVNFDPGGTTGGGSNSNVLLVKATPAELQLVQDILSTIDKNKNEVVLDVEIYEVSNDTSTQIGNQIATSPFAFSQDVTTKDKDGNSTVTEQGIKSNTLGSLGCVGCGTTEKALAFGLQYFNPTAGFLIGLPPSSLSFLQSRGNTKLLYKTQIHVLDGGDNTTKVGKKVPVSLGAVGFNGFSGFGGGQPGGVTGQPGTVGGTLGGAIQGAFNGFGGGGFGAVDQIQYQDVGLVIKTKPIITNEGYVEIKMEFETTDIVASGSTSDNQFRPTFTQRSLNTVARIQDGVTSVVAGVNQESKSDSRKSVPVLGMLPLVGRLFSAPLNSKTNTDIIITVTPHIIRSAGISQKDYLAYSAGSHQRGMNQSIDEVVNRAQAEEEEERRLIAQQNQGVPLDSQTTSVAPQATIPASQRTNSGPQTTVRPISNNSGQNNQNNGGRKAINDNSLIVPTTSSNPSVSVPTLPDRPQTEAPPEGGNSGGAQGKEGEQPDVSQFLQQPAQPVAPATVVGASRPENIERAIARMMSEERAKKAAEVSNPKSKQPEPEFPSEYMTPGPRQKVSPAAPKMTSGPGSGVGNNPTGPGSSGVSFFLSPKPIRQQIGKNFTVTVEVNSQTQMSGAHVALKFDDKKLRVKSVTDVGMFGKDPYMEYEIDKCNLLVRIKIPQNSPAMANGRLVTIEFETLAAGETEIAFNNNDTKARIGSALTSASGNSTTVIISRDNVASESK